MRKTLLAIVGVLVAPLAVASQAGAWPRDDYYYAPYPPAVVVLPPPPMRRHPIMPSPAITLLPSPPTVDHAMDICPPLPPTTLRRSLHQSRCVHAAAASTAIGTASIAPMRDTSARMSGRSGSVTQSLQRAATVAPPPSGDACTRDVS
jgi:hypothetical protein